MVNETQFTNLASDKQVIYFGRGEKTQHTIKKFLSHYCQNVHTFDQTNELVSILTSFKPDLIIIDFELIKENSKTFTSMLQASDHQAHISILVPEDDQKSYKKDKLLSHYPLLLKPLKKEHILHTLTDLFLSIT
jgi:two-component SAPR family response regulator